MATNPRAMCPRCWWCSPSKYLGHVCLSHQPSGPFLLSGWWGAWASTQNRHSVAVTIKRHVNPTSKQHMPRGACQAGGLVTSMHARASPAALPSMLHRPQALKSLFSPQPSPDTREPLLYPRNHSALCGHDHRWSHGTTALQLRVGVGHHTQQAVNR